MIQFAEASSDSVEENNDDQGYGKDTVDNFEKDKLNCRIYWMQFDRLLLPILYMNTNYEIALFKKFHIQLFATFQQLMNIILNNK